MGEIIVFIIIGVVISSIRKAAAKGEKERARQRTNGVPPVRKSAYDMPPGDPRFPPFTPQSQQHSRPMAIEAQAAEAERRRHAARAEELQKKREAMLSGSSGSPEAPRSAGAPMAAQVKVDNLEMKVSHLTATKGRKDTLEGRGTHAHVEGGITGGQLDCRPMAPIKVPAAAAAGKPESGRGSIFQRVLQYEDPLVQGMLMTEILGKPKSLRAGSIR